MTSASLIRFALGLLMLLLHTNMAEAHRFAPSLLKLTQTAEATYNAVWKTPTEGLSAIAMQPSWPAGCRMVAENPVLREGTGTVSSWTLDCGSLGKAGLVGEKLGVVGLAENQASAMVMLFLSDGRRYQSVVNAETPEFLVPAQPSQTRIMTEYSVLGTEHIWGGTDHLMFVLGLLLLVGGGTRLLWTITAFTLGHSVTLALVTLGLLSYPVALVEFAIALSIFILALELTRTHQASSIQPLSLFKRHPWWLAGGFGLLHGMGFAGALADIGLPQSNVPLALLFFNIGIEVGQIAFVLLLLGGWWLFNQALAISAVTLNRTRLVLIPVYLLGGLSAMWCIERGIALVS
ncbi:HupE/UreJ family protein [Pseudomonadales bacterium]|nr:HupE/UreJ family protein [Pseudomonadales bacterium]